MKNIINFVMCSLMFTIHTLAQTISGNIINKETGEPIPFISVQNIQNNSYTETNHKGDFVIKAQVNQDTLLFEGLNYKPLKLVAQSFMHIKLSSNVFSLGELVISANREQERRTEVPVAISSIDEAAIEENKPTTIDEVLNQIAGVNMVNLGNEQHTMSIRRPIDYGASYLYLEDGVPIRASGVFNHNALLEMNMANVNRIEVVRGPASSIYGSEAIGGAVNFISKKPSLNPTAGVSLQGNNLGYKRSDFYASSTINNKLGVRLAGYYANQKEGVLGHSDFDKLALSLSMNYNINDNTELSWSNSYIKYSSDMAGSLDSLSFYSKTYDSSHTFTYRKANALRSKIALNHYWDFNSKTTFTAFYRDNTMKQNPSYRVKDDYKPWTGEGDPNLAYGELNDNSFKSYGFITQHKQDFSFLNSTLIVGGSLDYSPNIYNAEKISIYKNNDGVYESFEKTNELLADYTANIQNLAAYTQLKFEPVNNLNFTMGLRYDTFKYSFDNRLGSNKFTSILQGNDSYAQITPKIGLTYDIDNNGFYANYSEGFVPPQVSMLYRGIDVPELKPVYYKNYEVGGWARLFDGLGKFEFSLYKMDGQNEIISVLQDDGSRVRQNAGKTTHKGVEYSVLMKLPEGFALKVNRTFAVHKFVDYIEKGEDFSGKKMPQAPNCIANTQLIYKPSYLKGFRTSIEWQSVSEYFMDRLNLKSYNGYSIFNVRLGYDFKAFGIWMNVMNVTDELYATVARSSAWGESYSLGRPRSFNFGLSYKFQ